MRIDLNADLGEGCGGDDALMPFITSANIACGAHAGDEGTMRATIALARRYGVSIGAHPSYPDRQNFGRTPLSRTPQQIESDVLEQIQALDACARDLGAALSHVKPHGALYNVAAREPSVADAISRAVAAFDPALALVGLAGGAQMHSARSYGLRPVGEVFADRRYTPQGYLVPRTEPQALIDGVKEAVAQAQRFVEDGIGETICLHGDGPHALAFARAIRIALENAGVRVQSFTN
jgi:UPF0271 protein